MASAGKIYSVLTKVEIDESGNIWLVLNHFEKASVIEDLQNASEGKVIIERGWVLYDDEYDYED